MELSFREWVEVDEAVKLTDFLNKVKSGAEYAMHHYLSPKGMPRWYQEKEMGYRNGVQMAQHNPSFTLANNPYRTTDIYHYNGWIKGFNFARGQEVA